MTRPPLLPLDQALEQVLDQLPPLSSVVELPLTEATGRVLAAPAHARVAGPPFANSAMDGYALRSDDSTRVTAFRVSRRILAGMPPGPALNSGEAVRIFTGAPLPAAADCVIAQEDAELLADDRVHFHERPRPGLHVRPQGQDFDVGACLGRPGDVIDSRRIALLAAAGVSQVTVRAQPVVAIVTTGDELQPVGAALNPGQIHDSNGPMLHALLRETGLNTDQICAFNGVADDPLALRETLDQAATRADVVLCSGGVSVGDADFVRQVMAEDGQMHFWRLALKPGRPFAFGHYRQRPFFGLPGNPVSTWVSFLLLVRPALLRLAGLAADDPRLRPATVTARLAAPLRKQPGRREFQRGTLVAANGQSPEVTALTGQASNLVGSLTAGNCLIDLPAESADLSAGAPVQVLLLRDLQRGAL